MPNILEVRQLVKHYGSFTAVNGVSFEIQAGEIFSLLGPNGAGKTTTISILSTLFPPTSGDAFVDGHSVITDALAVRRLIGIVPQEIALYEELTARENLNFWGTLYGLSGGALKSRVEEILTQIGLLDKASGRIKTYSGGMKRRVNIGVGLLHRPQLLFMDEPTVGIDPQSRRAILDMVLELNRQGMAVLYTTHYMEEAQELSHRVGIMDHGQMIAIGTVKELTRQVGETETLRFQVADAGAAAQFTALLQGTAGITRATSTGDEVSVMVPHAAEAIAPIVTQATEAGLKIRSLDVQEPNLEAVFLHLTGRALRD